MRRRRCRCGSSVRPGPAAGRPRPSRRRRRRRSRRPRPCRRGSGPWPGCPGRTTGSRTRRAGRSRTRSGPARAPPRMASRVCLPTSTMCHDAGIFSASRVLYSVPWVTSLATMTSTGRTIWTPFDSAIARMRLASSTLSCSARLLPTALPWATRKVLAIPPPRTNRSTLSMRLVEDLDLARHLGAADDRRERPLGPLEEPRQRLDLALHEQAGIGGQQLGDADRRGVGAVGRAECVVDVELGVVGQRLREGRVVLLLLDVEAEVLEQQRLARPQPLDGVLGAEPERVAGARDVRAGGAGSGARRPAGAGGRPGPCRRAGRGGWRG